MKRLAKNLDALKKEIAYYLIETLDIPKGTSNVLGITQTNRYVIVAWEYPTQEAVDLANRLTLEVKTYKEHHGNN